MKAFIIHLSKIEKSLETATNLYNSLKSCGIEAELFEGTYGNEAVDIFEKEQRILHPWGIKGPNSTLDHDPDDKSITKASGPGPKGCFYSHYRLWKKCAELNEPILIFEDDVVLSRGFEPVEWEDILVVSLGFKTKSEPYMKYLLEPSGSPKALPYTRSSPPGATGYAIKPCAAKKLLEMYSTTYLPADNAMNAHVVKLEIHNYIMGRALTGDDGKKSMVRTKYWNNL